MTIMNKNQNHLFVIIFILIKEKNLKSFILTICILFTFELFSALFSGFKETTTSSEVRQVSFCILLGIVIWGLFLYF